MTGPLTQRLKLFPRGSWPEASRIAAVLRRETVGGACCVGRDRDRAGVGELAVGRRLHRFRDLTVGPAALHLDLTLGTWAADGLLAIFFFVAGLELKREFVAGDLRDPRRAALPVVAAVGGMAVPALLFVLVNLGAGAEALQGWAIPTATDIAFALGGAGRGQHPPAGRGLRTFLLTLAVVDDLLAITIIAVFYTRDLQPAVSAAGAGAARRVRAAGAAAGAVVVAAGAAWRR